MAETMIRWTNYTWNPVRGCAIVSPGCTHCYAMGIAARFSKPGQPFHGFAEMRNGHAVWTGKVATLPEKLRVPYAWQRKAQKTGDHPMVFVNSMADLFHPDVPFSFVEQVFTVMEECDRVTFQILTKRPERMREYMEHCYADRWHQAVTGKPRHTAPRNVWCGTSAEDQRRADERIPLLLETPAAVRFLSMEPLLGPVDLDPFLWTTEQVVQEYIDGWPRCETEGVPTGGLHWIIVGGESGPGYRSMDQQWARDLRDQCLAAEVPFFFKQSSGPRTEMGQELDGERWEQFPERVA